MLAFFNEHASLIAFILKANKYVLMAGLLTYLLFNAFPLRQWLMLKSIENYSFRKSPGFTPDSLLTLMVKPLQTKSVAKVGDLFKFLDESGNYSPNPEVHKSGDAQRFKSRIFGLKVIGV